MPLQDREEDAEYQSGWEGFLEEVATNFSGIQRGAHVCACLPGVIGLSDMFGCVLGSKP